MLEGEKAPLPIFLGRPKDSTNRVRAASVTMLRQSRRLLWRSRSFIYSALASFFVCWLLLSASSRGGYNAIPWVDDELSWGADSSGELLRPPKGEGRPTSDDYNDSLARWLFSQEYNETGL